MMHDLFTNLNESTVEPKLWMKECKFVLVTEETIASVVDECIAAGTYALDLETTGLNTTVFNGETVDKIVGACLAYDGITGYYLPVRHQDSDANIRWSIFHQEMLRLVSSPSKAVFHNAKFDQEFLQFNGTDPLGEWDKASTWGDTLILAYLKDSRAKQKGLKYLSKKVLDKEMIELKELFPEGTKNRDFSALDPTRVDVLQYAGSDAICTYQLHTILNKAVLEPDNGKDRQKVIYNIEKVCVAATRWMERARIRTDRPKIEELIRLGQQEWYDALEAVYEEASNVLGRNARPGWFQLLGDPESIHTFDTQMVTPYFMDRVDQARKFAKRQMMDIAHKPVSKKVKSLIEKGVTETVHFPYVYDILSSAQLGMLLRELCIPGLQVTEASHQVQTSNDVIQKIIDDSGSKFAFLKRIERFRSTSKAMGTYLIPLHEDVHREVDNGETIYTVKAGFNAFRTDTGRFAAKTSKKEKQDGGTRFTFHGAPSTYDKSKPECLNRVRECVIPRHGKVLAGIDFAGVELRIVTALSGEPKWLAEFFRCSTCGMEFERPQSGVTPWWIPPFCPTCGSDKIGDIHTLTAQTVYGKEVTKAPDFKKKRGNAKSLNFALCYGGSGKAAQRATGVDENEGSRLKRAFDKSYNVLQHWWGTQKTHAHANGYVLSPFGRRCSLLPDIHLPKFETRTRDNGSKFRINNSRFIAKSERNAVNAPIQSGSADITKAAMVYVYLGCKERGWLDKVHMLMTIHDELVFEIDFDILEEAIAMIIEAMTLNPIVQSVRWPIPLNVDVELGPDWTVKWALNDFLMGHKPWPPELEPYFKKKHITYQASPSNGGRELTLRLGIPSTGDESTDTPEPAPASVPAPIEATEPASEGFVEIGTGALITGELTTGDPSPVMVAPVMAPVMMAPVRASVSLSGKEKQHVYPLPPLTVGMIDQLAQLILKVKNSGTSRAVFLTSNGTDVTSEFEKHWGGPLYVSPEMFAVLLGTERWE